MAQDLLAHRIDQSRISEELIQKYLYQPELPDPDLIIRTSGENRISNFLLWQSSYAEFYVTEVLWPDFGEQDLHRALFDYQQRERRYGKV
jgi:undecaprenyl diphosphate synthase